MHKTVVMVLLTMLSLFLPGWSPCFATEKEPATQLTEAETTFLRAHPVITLGAEKAWEPYVIVGDDGTITGYDAEILARVNTLTGANFQLRAGSWSEMQQRARSREIDGLGTGAVDDEQKSSLIFSDSYFSLLRTVLVQNGNPLQIHSPADLRGRTIAIHASNLADEKLTETFPYARLYHSGSLKETIEAVLSGQADAMFGNDSVLYTAQKHNLPHLQSAFPLDVAQKLAFSIRNDWPEAVSILNKGLAAIPEREKLEIKITWFLASTETSDETKRITLTQEEESYLSSRKPITLCTDPDWAPYISIDDKGEIQGIFAELHRMISREIGTEVTIIRTASWAESLDFARDRKCDVLLAAVETPERRDYLNFTSMLFITPNVIATKTDKLFIDNLDHLSGETLAIVEGYAVGDFIRTSHPSIQVLAVGNQQEGLRLVREGKVFGYVDSVLNIATIIQQQSYFDLKISGQLDASQDYALAAGIRNDDPLLLSIYNKAIATISAADRQRVHDQAIMVRYDKGFDYALFWKVLSGFVLLVVVGVLVFYLLLMRKHKRNLESQVAYRTIDLEEKNYAIERFNWELEQKNAELDRFTYTVSHDLKSPLITISGFVSVLEKALAEQASEEARTSLAYIRSAANKMYALLDDLLALSRVGRTVNPVDKVSLAAVTAEAVEMLRGQIDSCAAELRISDALPSVTGDFPRLREVMQNLIENALKYTNPGTKPIIEIGTADSDKGPACYVKDNGLGIPAAYHDKVFGLFERLHTEHEGTGIGLSLVKRIIELHDGQVWIESAGEGQGTTFWFTLPLVS